MSADAGYMLIRVDLQGAKEAAAEQAALNAEIVESGAATKGANAASATSATRGSKAGRAWTTAGKAAKYGALGLAGAVAGLGYAGVKAVGHMEELGLTAAGLRRNLDLTAQAGSRWAAVAEARGIAPTQLNMAFKTLATNLNSAHREGGTYMDTFKQIGVTQKEITDGTKDFDGFIQTVAQRFGDMEGSAKRQAAAAKLLGRGYQSVLPMFADGAKGMEEQLKWADKYHVTMGGKMVDDTVKLAQAQRESKVAWMGVQHELAEMFLPAIMDVHDEWQTFAEDITDPKLSEDAKIDLIGDKIESLADKAGKVLQRVIPIAVSHMAENAPKVAMAFVQGFLDANIWGKLLVGAWLIKRLAGAAIVSSAAKAALPVAAAFGKQFVMTTLGWIIGGSRAESLVMAFGSGGRVSTRLSGLSSKMGTTAGRAFGLGFVTFGGLVFADALKNWLEGTDAGNDVMDALGLNTDSNNTFGTGGLDLSPDPSGGGTGADITSGGDPVDNSTHMLDGVALTPEGYPVDPYSVPPGWYHDHPGHRYGDSKKTASDLPKGKRVDLRAAGGGGGDLVLENKIYLDGKQVGSSVRRVSRDKAARR